MSTVPAKLNEQYRINIYLDKEGNRTCAKSFMADDFAVCPFLRVVRFGLMEECALSCDNTALQRRTVVDEGGPCETGSLIPTDSCPLIPID